jgi:hypothetical protein
MASLSDTILKHCPGVPPALLDMHLRRVPETYHDRYAPAEIARHLRLLARLTSEQRVAVDVRSLGGQNLEICVAGYDRPGVLAALTTALASDGFDVHDLQLATYLPPPEGDDEPEPTFFIDVIRVSSARRGLAVADVAKSLRERLTLAFQRLAEGDLAAAQSAASDSDLTIGSSKRARPSAIVAVREGLMLEGFRLDERLATGGMSEVYLATQLSLNRRAAVKIVTGAMRDSPELSVRFTKEAHVLAGFHSPYIVQVFAAGAGPLANGTTLQWLAMEYLPNGDLLRWVKAHGAPAVDVLVRWLQQSLEGLHYAHQRGVLHRDIKPQNLLLSADGDVKLCDFGLVKLARQEDNHLTLHGTVMGTPQYISPEQALGEEADERSDLYSLGAAFFQLCSGRVTFEDKNTTSMLVRIGRDEPPRLLDVAPQLPRPLGVIVQRLLALRPEDRYQTVQVVLEDLRSYVQRGLLHVAPRGVPVGSADAPDAERTQALGPRR